MHEAALAHNIYDIVTVEMEKHPDSRLSKVLIDIGEFTHIDPETLSFAFEITIENSQLKDATLEIKRIPLILGCKKCKNEFSTEEMIFICPSCNSRDIEILKGREFRITELEIDDKRDA